MFVWSQLCDSVDQRHSEPTWWLIPLSKWVITPVFNGISRVNPLITGVITHLLSRMSHQVVIPIRCLSNDLSAYARQPARGPCWGEMGQSSWEQDLRAMLPLCWLCWPTLALCWPVLGPRLADLEAYVDPCWAKRVEKWDQQKNVVKRRIFWGSAAYLGAMLAYLRAMWAHLGAMLADLEGNAGPSSGYVGPSWGYVGPSWGYVGPSWGYVGPSWGLCCPILRPMLAHLEAYVGPCWPILNHKIRKMGKNGKSTKHRKTRWPDWCCTALCRRLLSGSLSASTASLVSWSSWRARRGQLFGGLAAGWTWAMPKIGSWESDKPTHTMGVWVFSQFSP